MTIEELQEKFRNDKDWNTLERNGSYRFDKKIAWIGDMMRAYAKALNLPEEKIVELAEKKRTYSWPNYYQKSDFPDIDSEDLVGVFETIQDFKTYAREHFKGFKCPRCGEIGPYPIDCSHRVAKDGKCDWTADGFLRLNNHCIIILEIGLGAIHIFEPVPKEETEE